jgi:hypothetical protein
VKLLGPDQLLERIAQRLDLLKGGRDADGRHATLRATIAWSYDLLTEDEQRLFARLAVFRGGCTLDAAEAVCGADLDTLASLLDKSLVRRRTDSHGAERFWMLETIRGFATELLHSMDEEDMLRRAQADLLIELADRAGLRAIVDAPKAWNFELVMPEMDNVRAVLDWSLESDSVRGLQLATWLEAFWVVRDPAEGASWLERLLAAAPAADPELRGRAWRALGGALDIHGKHERAATCYPTGLELFTATGNEVEAAHMRFRIAASMVFRGETAAAWPLLDEVLRESRRLGNRLGECQALGFLADRANAQGDHAGALAMTLESAAIAHEVGWDWWEAGQLLSAATREREQGNLDAARRHAHRSLELSLGLGDHRSILFSAAALAIIAAQEVDPARAGLLWGAIETEVRAGRVGPWERR